MSKTRPSWDELFMKIVLAVSERSACKYHKVASVFVDDDHRVVSIGYNGPSVGDYHCIEYGCAKIDGDPITGEIKRCRGAHSEINAIINSGDTQRLKNSTLYISTFPCYDCMKELNNLGIKRIVYLDEYLRVVEGMSGKEKNPELEAKELAIKRGIIFERFRFEKPEKSSKTNKKNSSKK